LQRSGQSAATKRPMNVTRVPPTSAVPRVGWCKREADCYRRDGC
jgi:hypothetical protein